jgi:hypothetical protein
VTSRCMSAALQPIVSRMRRFVACTHTLSAGYSLSTIEKEGNKGQLKHCIALAHMLCKNILLLLLLPVLPQLQLLHTLHALQFNLRAGSKKHSWKVLYQKRQIPQTPRGASPPCLLCTCQRQIECGAHALVALNKLLPPRHVSSEHSSVGARACDTTSGLNTSNPFYGARSRWKRIPVQRDEFGSKSQLVPVLSTHCGRA